MAERESPRAPVSTGPELVLSMLDGLTVSVSRSSVRIPGLKAQALLAYLACESSGCGITRERLCGLLWSESSDEKARASLRQSLH
ncbi:MAG TPA: hypothetical protein VFE52_02645, partial [Devosia sp.]|nr:hypothetical protein [Devosia sp.]